MIEGIVLSYGVWESLGTTLVGMTLNVRENVSYQASALGGSWVVLSGVISRATRILTQITGLVAL